MQIYRYLITLHDSLYYAREGLGGAITPPLIHPTAVNGALATAMNCNSENQPFLISEANGGRNRPRYKNSCLCNAFYATAASVRGEVRYRNEIAKAENDGFMEVHKRSANKTKNKKRISIK